MVADGELAAMSEASSDRRVSRVRARTAGWLLLALLCVGLLVAGSGPAAGGAQVDAENDTQAPEWGNATVSEGSFSTLNVTFSDNGRIDQSSITADDFNVSGREVREIESKQPIGGNNTGVAVLLRLDGPATVGETTVRFQENGSVVPQANTEGDGAGIADEGGNELTSGSVAVTYADSDTAPPEWGTATRVTGTEINVTFYDNRGIDTSSIDASNFTVNPGSVESVSDVTNFTDGGRSGVYFSLHLADPLSADSVTIGFNGSITDTDGNRLASGTRTVTGMDAVSPEYRGYTLDRVNGSTVDVHVATNEPLDTLRVTVTGPVNDTLTRSDFREHGSDTLFYTAQYRFSEEGSYSFVWDRAGDRNGNTLRLSAIRNFYYEDNAPDVILEGPHSTSVETPVSFSAASSTDEDGIESVRWRIDGGTVLTGETVEVAFASAGTHELVVEVTDGDGNTAIQRRTVRVSGTDGPVRFDRHNATHATATVEGTGFVQQVRGANGSVVESSNASLDRLNAAFPSGVNASLAFRAADSTPDSLNATGLGLFEITHSDVPADSVAFRFSVDAAVFNRVGAEPADVSLYRFTDGWTELETTVVSRGEGTIVYGASSPGLSQFAVAVEDSGTPEGVQAAQGTPTQTPMPTESPQTEAPAVSDIAITNVTVNETNPSVNDTVSINVTARNRGSAAGNRTFAVLLNDTSLGSNQIAVGAGETRTQEYVYELPQAGPLDVAGQRVATVGSGGGLLGSLPVVGGIFSSLPNPLALWPGGLVGTVLAGLVGLSVVTFGVLKGLAIYLGY